MAAEVFTWKRMPGSAGKVALRARHVSFGDGYEQSVADGINNAVQTWPMSFEGTEEEMQPIYDFFVRHGGWKSFLWQPPFQTKPLLWKAKNFSVNSIGGGLYSVTADFTQSFTP